jgi:hypothetical protein
MADQSELRQEHAGYEHSATMDDVFSLLAKVDSEREAKARESAVWHDPPTDPPAGGGYDPLWNIGGGTHEEREQFRRNAGLAVAAIGRRFANPAEAVDSWLTEVRDFHVSRNNSQYTHNPWCIRDLRNASANYCVEHAVRTELEQQFKQTAFTPPGVVGSGLYAILRREPNESDIKRLKAEDAKAATACTEFADDTPPAESVENENQKHQRQYGDLNAVYARRHGRDINEADLQEELIRDARKYAESYLAEANSPEDRLKTTRSVWKFLKEHPKRVEFLRQFDRDPFRVNFDALHSAIWTEGYPSLEERANCHVEGEAPVVGGGVQDADQDVFGLAPKKAENACSESTTVPEASKSSSAKPTRKRATAMEIPQLLETNWEDVELCFASDDQHVTIRIGREMAKYHYKQIGGFEDIKSGNPNILWATLKVFAMAHGTIPENARDGKEWLAIRKRIERIRKALQTHLNMTGDPIPYIKGEGYRSRFKVSGEDEPVSESPERQDDTTQFVEAEFERYRTTPIVKGRGAREHGRERARENRED